MTRLWSTHARVAVRELRVEALGREVVDGVASPGTPGARQRIDLALVAYFEDERPLRGLAAFLDWRSDGRLTRMLRSGWCTGRAGESVLMPGTRGLPCERIVLFGLGPSSAFGAEQARVTAAAAVDLVRKLLPRSVLFAMPGLAEDREIVEALFAGIVLALGGTPGVPTDDEVTASPPPSTPAPLRAASGPNAVAVAPRATSGPSIVPTGPTMVVDPPADDAFDDGLPGAAHLTPGGPASPGASSQAPATPGASAPTSLVGDGRRPCRWWVIADARHVGRLRRVLDGPPRAAADSSR